MKRFDKAFLMVLLLLFATSNIVLGQHFESATNQGISHSLILRSSDINGEALSNDDEIAVFTPDGVCAGVKIIDDDPPWGLVAFGDNPNTQDEVEGFLVGEAFAFKFWDSSAEVEEELHVEWDGDPQKFQDNGIGNILRMLYFSDPIPVISLSASEHAFETMGVDHSRYWTLRLTNIGFGALTIEDVSLNSQAFGTNFENEVELDIYESYDLIVNFTPSSSGNFQGTLTIVSDDPDNGEANITLTGTGTEVIEPAITFDYDEIDFGEWPVERNMERIFNLTIGNSGTGDLTISNARITGDNVFDVDWDGEVVIEPFDEYVLGLMFEPDDQDTDYEGVLTIYSDDPNNEEAVFDLMGRGVEITSHYVWINGPVGADHSLLINEAFIDGEVLDVRDEIAVFTPEGLCAGGDMITERAGRVGFSAWARDAQSQTPGFLHNGDEIEYRMWDASAEVEFYPEAEYLAGPDVFAKGAMSVLRLTAVTPDEPIIDVSLLEVDYGDVGVNFSEDMDIRIRNNGRAALRITYVESSEPDIFVPDFGVGVLLQHREEYELSVAFEPPDIADYEGQILITSNGSEEPVVVDVSGSGIEPPAIIQIDELAHDFGPVERGTQVTWDLVITNIGWENLTIDSVKSDEEAFTHDFGEEAVVLERDEDITVTVTFDAAEAQEYEGILTVYSNDPDEEDQVIEIELTGEGINVPDIRVSRMLVDFGDIEIFTEETFTITVFNDGEANLYVSDMTLGGGDAGFFDTDYDGAFTVEPEGEHDIIITFSPVPIRAYSAEIHLISNDLDEDDVRIRLAGSGVYVAHDPEVLIGIPDYTLQEDFDEFNVADLDTIFFDANDENMEFSVSTNRNALHAEIRNGSRLWLSADADWNGSGTVRVTADDGVDRDNAGPVRSLRGNSASQPSDISNARVMRGAWGAASQPNRDGEGEEEFDVTVEAQNDEPVWTVVPDPISETEATEIAFRVEGEDVDNDDLTITYSSDDIPDAVSFTDNEDGTADFSWTPTYMDAGDYTATFTLSDDEFDIEADVEIEVTNVNREPTWDDIEDRYEIPENDELIVTISGSDPDEDALTISWASDDLPEEFEFTDNDDGSGTIYWQPNYEDAGEYSATFTISDGESDVSHDVTIVVSNTNRTPEWTDVPEEVSIEVDVEEEEVIQFSITGTDADGVENLEITYSSDDIPEAAGFTDNGNGEGDFSWTITIDDAGSYTATFTLSDGEDVAVAETRIIIIGSNQPPEWVEVDDTGEWPEQLEVDEAQTLEFTVHGTDPDEDDVANLEISYSSDDLPEAVSFEDQGEGAGLFSWDPSYLDAGEYTATFTITDGIYNVDGSITIIVNNVNRDPGWVEIPGDVEVSESEQIQFSVTASDPDEDDELTLTYNSDNLPEAVVFEDNGAGSGSFTWDTGFLDAGQYTVTFTVNDGYTDVTSDEVNITVNDRNAPPEWIDPPEIIRAQEGDLIDVDVTAADVDENDLTLTARDLPDGCNFTDNHNGIGSLVWDTNHEDEGNYTVTLIASDAEYNTEVEIPIEVTNVNQAPEWTYAPNHVSIDEDQDWSLTVTGEDVDGDDLTITYETEDLPEAATFEDHGNGTATLSWQPDYTEAGQYEAAFVLSDGLIPNRTIVRITVRDVDRGPVWDEELPDVTVDEGDLVEFSMSGSDPDGDELTILFSSDDLPDAVEFMDYGEGRGDFSWQTGFEDGGEYTATFTLSSNDLEVEMDVNISVGNVNHNPVWVDFPGSQHGDPGAVIEFELRGQDEDDDDLTITYTPDDELPAAGDVFTDRGNGTAVFSWQTEGDDTGDYLATFTLSDGVAEISRTVIITIGDVNQPPAWTDIPGSFTINENYRLNFSVEGSDPDVDNLTITARDLPEGAEFTDNHDGTGDFTWQPNYDQAGQYVIWFTISDGSYDIEEDVRIRVNDLNRSPQWEANMPPRSPSGDENSTLSFIVRGSDPDGDAVSFRMVSDDLPDAAEFEDNGDGTGSFTWQTTYDDAGTYNVMFYISDGTAEVPGESNIRVINVNRSPAWINPQEAITANEGDMVRFRMRGTDPDGLDDLSISFDEDGLPEEAEFVDYGEGTGFFTWPTNFDDMGEYTATFTLSDGAIEVEHEVAITIEYVNRSPYWVNVPDAVEGDEDEWTSFNVTAYDPDDDDELTISYDSDDIPEAATFVDNGNGRGYFAWKPTYEEAGEYTAVFTVSDGNGMEVTESTTITINDVNRVPVWDALPNAVRVNENEELVLNISGSDPDGDDLTLSYAYGNVPDGAEFTDIGDGSATLVWTPSFEEAGDYLAAFTISDGELSADPHEVIIAVGDVNRSPEITNVEIDPGNEIDETDRVTISIESTDPDGDELTVTWESETVSDNVEYYDNGDGTATLFWTSGYEDGGEQTITFTVDDGRLEASEDVVITVNEVNRAPFWADIPEEVETNEGDAFNFQIIGDDPDGTGDLTIEYSSDDLPETVNFMDRRNGRGSFAWRPTFTDAGEYTAVFTLSDGEYEATAEMAVIVNNVNHEPTWDDDPATAQVDEAQTLEFRVTGNDDDDDDALTITYNMHDLPDGFEVTDSYDGTAGISWTPGYEDAGEYTAVFTLSDGYTSVDKEVVITVNDVNRAPIWTRYPAEADTSDEKTRISFIVEGMDPDGDDLTIEAASDNLPEAAEFTDNGEGVGSFVWQTTNDDAGEYSITFTLSDGVETDEVTVELVINDINRAPELVGVPAETFGSERSAFQLRIEGRDLDGDDLTLEYSSEDLPEEAEFTVVDNGVGVLNWTPGSGEAGDYTAHFMLSDGELTDEADISIHIEHVNRAPYFVSIPSVHRALESDEWVSFEIVVGDSDGGDLEVTYTSDDLAENDNHTLAEISADTREFQWVIDYDHAGEYVVTFTVSDGEAEVSEDVTIIIVDTSRPPEWTMFPDDELDYTETDRIYFALEAIDPDMDEVAIELLNIRDLPEGIDFEFMGWIEEEEAWFAEFTWQTTYEDEGQYTLQFNATDHESDVPYEVTVNIAGLNRDPEYVDIPELVRGRDNERLEFNIVASDPDNDDLSLSLSVRSVLPDQEEAGYEIIDNEDNTWTFVWDPGYDYTDDDWSARFVLSDGTENISSTVFIEIENVNREPEYTNAPPDDMILHEGGGGGNVIRVSDPDGTIPTLEFFSDLPEGIAEFVYNRQDQEGTFDYYVNFDVVEHGDTLEYTACFVLSDAESSDTTNVPITIYDTDQRPHYTGNSLPDIDDFMEDDDERLAFNLFDRFIDDDGPEDLEFEVTQDPELLSMRWLDNGDFFIQPIANINGSTEVIITVIESFDYLEVADTFMVTITPVNDPGRAHLDNVFPGSQFEMDEDGSTGDLADLDTLFYDPEGDSLGFNFSGGDSLGIGIDTANVLSINPLPNWNGVQDFTIIVEDFPPNGAPRRDDIAEYVITVTVNAVADDPPVVTNPIVFEADEGFEETEVANLDDVFRDPDGQAMTYAVTAEAPLYAYIDYYKNIYVGVNDDNYFGEPGITLTATDEVDSMTTYDFTITVLNINDPPVVMNEIDDREYEEDSGPWTIADLDSVFYDPDGVGDPLYYDAEISSDMVTWEINDDNVLIITAADNFVADDVQITVFCNDTLEGALAASPFEHDKVTGPVRTMRSVNSRSDVSNVFGFSSIDARRDTEVNDVFTLTVTALNDAPTWDPAVPATATGDETTAINFTITAEDLDMDNEGDALTLTMTDDGGTAALGATFTDNSDGTGDYAWLTDYSAAGEYTVTFEAADQAGAVITHTVMITVGNMNRVPVVAAEIPDLTFD
ncbi:tandem-95 repeat protein, partial [bacterium]|nr:tandem-95 repeat protein [bacterium]